MRGKLTLAEAEIKLADRLAFAASSEVNKRKRNYLLEREFQARCRAAKLTERVVGEDLKLP